MIKIAITGPESTGKSSISEELAEHYKTLWVPEFARKYLSKIGQDYTEKDVLQIAKGQYRAEQNMLGSANRLLICDTDFIVLKIWHEYKYNTPCEWINEKVSEHIYDLYLLMDTDIEWKFDPLRENPDNRTYFFELFKTELQKNNFNYKIIQGTGEERTQNAIKAIDAFLKSSEKNI